MVDDPVVGPVPTGYCIDSMLVFLKLVNRMLEGTKLEAVSYTHLVGADRVAAPA